MYQLKWGVTNRPSLAAIKRKHSAENYLDTLEGTMDLTRKDLALGILPKYYGFILISGILTASAAIAQQFPDGPGKETTLRLCSGCHNADIVFQHRQGRDEWNAEIQKMIASGAQGTPAQFNEVLTYLAASFGPGQAPAGQQPAPGSQQAGGRRAAGGPGGRAGGRRGGFTQFTRPLAPQDVLARGKGLYETNCASCHAPDLRGSENGTRLLRSLASLNDKHGELIGQAVAEHNPKIVLNQGDTVAVAEYIHSVLATTGGQGSPPGRNPVGLKLDILVGDAKAGERYFDKTCAPCHSAVGDLKGLASKYPDPRSLQNAWVAGTAAANPFGGGRGGGGAGNPVTVTMADGSKLEGKLVRKDDFLVILTLLDGTRRSIARHDGVPKVQVKDPNEAHKKMALALDDPENKNLHDVTAYLATLK
jgi:cytochrome c oxidase cbb3-type subunit 3